MVLNVCLFGGPGVGKSTLAAKLFAVLKDRGVRVEYLTEYAKGLVFRGDVGKLGDQLYILAKQHHMWARFEDLPEKERVDVLVHDSPFLLSLVYNNDNSHLLVGPFEDLVVGMHKSYRTLDVFLCRDVETHGYQRYGRQQTLEEAIEVDAKVLAVLVGNSIPFHEVSGGSQVDEILALIAERLGQDDRT